MLRRMISMFVVVVALVGCASEPRASDISNSVLWAGGTYTTYTTDGFKEAGAIPMPAAPLDLSRTLTRIIFASCARQDLDQSIWDQIASESADLTLFIGDNVYGDDDPEDPELKMLAAAYGMLALSQPFARARAAAPMLTVWDDHDYGLNDGGGDYLYKVGSELLYDYVWAVPEDDPRRARPGVHGAWVIGEAGRRVQIILLDTRFFRSELKPSDKPGVRGKERYIPDPDPSKTMLGADQWAWLEGELKKPADLRLLVSSVQIISDGHGWEGWKMLPAERDQLYTLIEQTGADNLIMLSGDRHAAGLYRRNGVIDYPLFEATSSSLNRPLTAMVPPDRLFMEPGPNRLGDMYMDANYGMIEIDWEAGDLAVTIRDGNGATVLGEFVELAVLRSSSPE